MAHRGKAHKVLNKDLQPDNPTKPKPPEKSYTYKSTDIVDNFIKANGGKPNVWSAGEGIPSNTNNGAIFLNITEFVEKNGHLITNRFQTGKLVFAARQDFLNGIYNLNRRCEENCKTVNKVQEGFDKLDEDLLQATYSTHGMIKQVRGLIRKKKSTTDRVKKTMETIESLNEYISEYVKFVGEVKCTMDELVKLSNALKTRVMFTEQKLTQHLGKLYDRKFVWILTNSENKCLLETTEELKNRASDLETYIDLATSAQVFTSHLSEFCYKMESPSQSFLKRAFKSLQDEIDCLENKTPTSPWVSKPSES